MGHRCLIIGASGQLGRALCAEFRARHEVIEAAHRATRPDQWPLDLADPAATARALTQIAPEWIVIAGAIGNVDRAELEQALCLAVNVEGPKAVAEYAQAHGCTVAYYSTDAVFDGTRDSYQERDPVAPLNFYARSKARAETIMHTMLPGRSLVIRTAWLYGPDERRRIFILRLVDELRAGRSVEVPSDQWGSPTYTEDVAHVTRVLLEQGAFGLFHAVGPEVVNRAALAQQVCEQFGLEASLLQRRPSAQLNQVARRPLRVQLDCRRLHSMVTHTFRTLMEGLEALRSWDSALVAG